MDYRGGKEQTWSYQSLDVRWVHRQGMLHSAFPSIVRSYLNGKETGSIQVRGQSGHLLLEYTHQRGDGKDPEHLSYPVRIDWTPCNYGGNRPWFLCPAQGCGRRVAILYGGRIFACRHCYKLVYESQHQAPHTRALRQAQKIRMKLGGSASIRERFPWKPKGMHWRTYSRLYRVCKEAEQRCWPPWLLRTIGKPI